MLSAKCCRTETLGELYRPRSHNLTSSLKHQEEEEILRNASDMNPGSDAACSVERMITCSCFSRQVCGKIGGCGWFAVKPLRWLGHVHARNAGTCISLSKTKV